MVAVNDILSQYKFDTPKHGSGSCRGGKQDKPNEDGEKDDVTKLAFVQMIGKCYCCGSPNHKSPECPHKDKPKAQWAINQSNIITDMTQPTVNDGNNNQRGVPAWQGTHIQFAEMSMWREMKDWILLDSQSSATVFCNSAYVENIHKAKSPLQLATNGGLLTVNHCADLPDYGEVWFSEKSMTNIFSMAEVSDKVPITFDSKVKDTYIVKFPAKTVKFKRTTNNLYVFNPKGASDGNIRSAEVYMQVATGIQMLSSVEENRRFYTDQEFGWAMHS